MGGRPWRREPLLHFVVLGGLLFGVAQWRDRQQARDDAIVVDATEQARLVARFAERSGREPTDDERQRLIAAWADQEMLLREATRLGLDDGDPIIRRRILTKIEYVIGEEAVVGAPDDATLEAFVAEHPERYSGDSRSDFVLVTFAGPDAEARARDAKTELEAGIAPEDVGGRVAQSKRFTAANVVKTYGPVVGQAVQSAKTGEWVVVDLDRAWAVLRVTAKHAGTEVPPLSRIRNQATRDWADYQRAQAVRKRLEVLREEYDVVVEEPEP